ncbi:MAG TPA: hypothetical protein PKM43_00010 [Verrucomicrobiota bacterium]|nr:hypothetical protein [Verrucomicrobiota bacterium]
MSQKWSNFGPRSSRRPEPPSPQGVWSGDHGEAETSKMLTFGQLPVIGDRQPASSAVPQDDVAARLVIDGVKRTKIGDNLANPG